MSEGRSMRFGVREGDRFAPYWKATASATRPEAFVTLSGLDCHVSLHESADHWHFKVRTPSGELVRAYRWDRPKELRPSMIRALCLITTPSAISDPGPKGADRVQWMVLEGPEQWHMFDLFLEGPLASPGGRWPGRDSMRTILVGRLPLANGWQLTIVHHTEPGSPLATFHGRRPAPEIMDRMKALASSDPLRMVVAGDFPDGTIALVHGAAKFG